MTVTACSDKTTSVTSEVCMYTLTVTMGTSYPILTGSVMYVNIPQELTMANFALTQQYSNTSGIDDSKVVFNVVNSSTIMITNGFSSTSKTQYSLNTF